jgi:lipopolysaccharide export system permease protein
MMVLGRPNLPNLGLIDRYLAKQIAAPLFGSLVLAAMLLVLDKMLRLFQYVVDAGGPVSVVWKMLANLLPEYLSLGIPIGLMLGILLAFRKLALSSELDALRGIGVGYGRLLRVPYMYAVPLLIINLLIVGYLEPYTHYRYKGLQFDLKSGALGAAITVGEFNQLGKRITLRIERSEKKGTQLFGIFVRRDDAKGNSIAATAERGRFLASDNPDEIIFQLTKGRLVQTNTKFATPRTLAFDRYNLPVSLPAIDQFRGRAAGETDELYLHELWRLGYGGMGATSKERIAAEAHFNFRMVEVVMMLMLPLLAIALAVPPKRSTSGLGIFVSILIVVAYHKVNQYADAAAARGGVDPTLGLWLPLILLSALIFWMYHVLAHKPGGQPIGALEWFFAAAAKRVRALIPKPRDGRIGAAEAQA